MTTPFDVNINFLGIFAIVPDKLNFDDIQKIALVVPKTDLEDVQCDHNAQDRKPLYRHRWFIEYRVSQLVDAPSGIPVSTVAHWPISRPGSFHRLTFSATGSAPLKAGTALKYITDFPEVAPYFADLPADYLKWPEELDYEEPLVAGQVMFNIGELKDPPRDERQQWIFPGTLRPEGTHDQPASHKFHLHLDQVTTFELIVRATREDECPHSLKLQGTPRLPCVEINICNLCDVNPLRWPTTADPRIDDDFRWYYQVCGNKDELEDCLHGLDLPVPHPTGELNALGQNCLSTKFKDQAFTLD